MDMDGYACVGSNDFSVSWNDGVSTGSLSWDSLAYLEFDLIGVPTIDPQTQEVTDILGTGTINFWFWFDSTVTVGVTTTPVKAYGTATANPVNQSLEVALTTATVTYYVEVDGVVYGPLTESSLTPPSASLPQ